MVIIRIKVDFTLLLSATCFRTLYRSHVQAEVFQPEHVSNRGSRNIQLRVVT